MICNKRMSLHLVIFWIGLEFSHLTFVFGGNPLDGKHLRLITLEYPCAVITERNVTGHVIHFEGVLKEYIEVLSAMLNFSYTILPVNPTTLDDSPSGKGALYYIIQGEVDYVLSSAVPLPNRLKYVDYPTNWFNGPFSCLVPYPTNPVNISATIEPLNWQVWLTIFLTTVAVVWCLRLLNYVTLSRPEYNTNGFLRTQRYVWGNLISQGQPCYTNRLAVRFVAGAWCLACFFLVQIYCSTLTSHLMASNEKPLADSLNDLVDNPNANLVVDKGLALDIIFKSMGSGIYKKIGDSFKRDPDRHLCNTSSKCLKTVKDGRNTAYCNIVASLKSFIEKDFEKTGTCHYYMMKNHFLSSPISTVLPKNSPYTEIISRSTLRFKAAGLLDRWISRYIPGPRKCLQIDKQSDSKLRPLSMRHLSSPFLILGAGYILSILCFIVERLSPIIKDIRKR